MSLLPDPQLIGYHIRSLTRLDVGARKAAVAALGEMGPAAELAVPHLARLLEDADEGVRIHAAHALGRIGLAARGALLAGLDNPSKYVRRQAIWALRRFPQPADQFVPVLCRALKDPDMRVRKSAALALGHMGPDAKAAVPDLIEALKERGLVFCRLASWALARIGTSAVPALQVALSNSDWFVRREAIRLLTTIHQDGQARASTLPQPPESGPSPDVPYVTPLIDPFS
jgi:HEAT repeat protein